VTLRWRALGGLALLCAAAACSRPAPDQRAYTYPAATGAACAAGVAAPSRSDDEATARGVKFSVRAPLNYDAAYRHALLVMYAPAGYSRFSAERYYAMTGAATAAGMVVAYANHVPLSADAVQALGEVPARVASRWCIDAARVYFAGHSDGGSISMGVTFMGKSTLEPSAIVASGAGIRAGDLAHYQCPRPTRITLLHSVEDERFPGYGEETIAWWAKCNACGARASQSDGAGCFAYAGCAAPTRFCPTRGAHARWPATPAALLDFLGEAAPPPR
jgi:polyhydroxybutyrate depolymerase